MNLNPKNSKECADKIQSLNLEYLKEVSIKNTINVKKNFSWAKEVDKLIYFYKELSK